MKKNKLLALFIAGALSVSMLTACGSKDGDTDVNPTQGATATKAPTQAVEQDNGDKGTNTGKSIDTLRSEATYYVAFDGNDTCVVPYTHDTSAGTISNASGNKELIFVDGVNGKALYSDGSYGYKLEGLNGVGNVYTVSFWVNSKRCANYMPTLQFGPDIHGDLTGGQHYVNFTWAEWSGSQSFPNIWAYDQLDDAKWPYWFIDDNADTHVGEWMMLTLVVDGSLTEDGLYNVGKVYVNGVLQEKEANIVFNTMEQSDNFEYLLGVNYWDSYFKGAFDEFYVFASALSDDDVKTLYAAGNASATYTEPERKIEVTKDETAIKSLGTTSYELTYDAEKSDSYTLSDGQKIQIKLKNWSKAGNTTDNYSIVFTDGTNAVASVNADATGTLAAEKAEFTWNWGNWKTWLQKSMVEVTATINIERIGNQITVEAHNVDFNATDNLMTVTFTCDNVKNFYITGANCYIDILKVSDISTNSLVTYVGNTDCTSGWWSSFSEIWAVPANTTREVSFKVHTSDTASNWNTFVTILQKTPEGHDANTSGYGEYAVLRTDNYGWGDGYSTAVLENNYNDDWANYLKQIKDATATVKVTNNGATADVVISFIGAEDGQEYYQKYTGITTGGDLYFCLGIDGSCLEMDTIVGNTDCTSGWWTSFSDIWKVEEGATETRELTVYTPDSAANWNTFVTILQKTPEGHDASTSGYGEYAVLRTDNYGWGDGYSTAVLENNFSTDWANYLKQISRSKATVTVTNNGATADVVISFIGAEDGQEYYQKYTGVTTGGDLYFCFGIDTSCIVIGPER